MLQDDFSCMVSRTGASYQFEAIGLFRNSYPDQDFLDLIIKLAGSPYEVAPAGIVGS
ncbi:hypothetical protein ACQ0QQ_04905 [Lysinibacillus sphaericus]